MSNEKQWFHEPGEGLSADEKAMEDRQRALQLLNETAKIEQRQSAWYELNLWNATLYSNRELTGFRWGAEINAESELWPANLRSENIIENIGQSMLAKASSSPLRPGLVPHGNSWKTARAVRIADRFVAAVWHQTEAEDACVQMFNDAYTAGLGCVQVDYDADNKKITVEPVFFDNIVIDNRECANRAMPKTYRVRKAVPAFAVEALYGISLSEKDRKAPYTHHRPVGEHWVVIVEAWRLPDRDGKNGRHMVACCGQLMVDEKWEHQTVPLVFFHWQDRLSGFFTKSGVEQVIPFQVIQNDLNDDIKESQDVACRARVLAHANSNLDYSQWDSKGGRILTYSGVKPESMTIQTNLAELYGERERNKAAAYSHMGLSEMFANADVPNQIRADSSAGVREIRNMEDARHLRLWTRFERARLAVAETVMDVLSRNPAADAFLTTYKPKGARKGSQSIAFGAIKHLTKEVYSWTLEAVSTAQQKAGARRELLRDSASRGTAGAAGMETGKAMLANPNIEALEDAELAHRDDIERHLELLENEEYEAPDEFTNIPLGLAMVSANMKKLLRFEDVDKTMPMIKNHVRWLVDAASIQVAATMPPPGEQVPPPMTPFQPTQGMPGTQGPRGIG